MHPILIECGVVGASLEYMEVKRMDVKEENRGNGICLKVEIVHSTRERKV